MRLVAIIAVVLGLGFAGAADAQPEPGQPQQMQIIHPTTAHARAGVTVDPAGPNVTSPHGDLVASHSTYMALLFWLFAVGSVGGALFVITRRNLITAVMGMVGTFLGIAAIYMMLYASFLSVVQMLVYAGAIMVLFVFVIMILNRPEDEPVAPSGRAGQVIGGISILYLIGRLCMMLIHVHAPAAAMAAPAMTAEGHAWGSVKAVGTDLFNNGLFPFEAISILLLVAVVGAIAIARPLHEDQDQHDPDGRDLNARHEVHEADAVSAAHDAIGSAGGGGH